MPPAPDAAISPIWAALAGRCPRCGQGKLFAGLLTVRPACPVCGLDLSAHDAGDGPAVAVILVLGAVIVGLAFWVEFTFSPPLWVHAVLWPVVTVPLAIAMMRPLKAALIVLQYRYRRTEMGP
ncbi:MAG: DUF983 domain-containing protein [Acidibrevibacterium sp.]|jgi:uncharacterized protein (DUF983 family)|uniref:DUF983 domain-containing protein n=1 Tax=Acidibrevibacterium fodinaquatile TaxID=1969806 RepID=UPI000E0CD311|nr:DUF983 domain-containing protein [Acidibrevibacterium fodinaquatile]MCA7119993.1 DUF983 domain-containing protein [Acidibrevibacterium fodinaquatile]